MKRSITTLVLAAILVVSIVLVRTPAPVYASTQIYFTNFNTGYSDWTSTGNVSSVSSPSIQPNSVKLNGAGASITKSISTVGYNSISVTWNMAASSLESGEYCYVEYNTGSGWVTIGSLTNGQDTSTFYSGTTSSISGADNNPNFQVRYRIQTGSSSGDYCYAEDTTVSGTTGAATNTPTLTPTATQTGPTPTPTSTGVIPVPGDPLTGSGNVSRTVLTYNDLMTGSSTAPVDDGAFAVPANAAAPSHVFEGTLHLVNNATSGGATVYKDSNRVFGNGDQPIKHLPDFDFQFVQNGSYLIPVTQGLYYTGNAYWNYLIGPGRVWNENSDNGYTRASFPFALVEYNQNCTHNGVMTFLFNDAGISQVRYQITAETCYLEQFDFYGQLQATYTRQAVANDMTLENSEAVEVSNRLPTKPISALATDYPNAGLDLSQFGSGVTPSYMTWYGVYINGVNYVSGCTTRDGQYAYCDNMRAPSYSTAKSSMAGVGLMRLGQKYGTGVYNLLIKDYVPEYASSVGNWSSVTFNNTADMATGNYRLAGFESDENGSYMAQFLADVSYTSKIADAFNFPYKAAPGTKWIYHTSDIFILGRAENNYLESQGGGDIWSMLVNEVYAPAHMSTGFMTTLRTDDSVTGVPFSGYGLFWSQDDVAKMAKLLNNDHGVVNGTQVLQPNMLDDSMQRNPNDRGVDTSGTPTFKYNNTFWAAPPSQFTQYSCPVYIPFMSGYGGITVAMAPNGATYYYFSDNNEFSWYNAINETNKINPMCP
ncbi:MAG: hypothetical protein M1282_11255 [Chloroflexi bacterium]|nr:hypothetical protein [Chloroflexota bacterium]